MSMMFVYICFTFPDRLTYWSFHLLVPLIVGWSAIYCVTGLMAFLHLDLSLARLIFRCFLLRSALIASFHLNFGLPWGVALSTLKLMIFFFHDVSSCRYKLPDNLSLFHLRTSLMWWSLILLLRSSVECFCSVLTLLNQWIIAESHHLIRDKSSVDRGQDPLPYRRALLTQAINTFLRFTRDILLFVSIGRISWKAFQVDPIRAVTTSVQPPACPMTSPR